MDEKKEPHQEFVKADPSDDESIIDLVDEVVTKSEDDSDILESKDERTGASETTDDIVPPTDGQDSASEDDEDVIASQKTEKSEPQKAGAFIYPNDQVPDDIDEMEEDEMIASAIEEALGPDDDDGIRLAEEPALKFQEDRDIVKPDDGPVDVQDNLAATAGDDTLETKKDEDGFAREEEIELEYEIDENEYHLLSMDDEHAGDDDETDDLPDLAAGLDIGLEDDDGTNGIGADDELETEDRDPNIERAVEKLLSSEDDYDRGKLDDETEFESADDREIMTPDDALLKDKDIFTPADEEILEFEHGDDLLDLPDELDIELEDDDDINGISAKDEPEAEDSDKMIKRSVEKSFAFEDDYDRGKLDDEIEFESADDREIMTPDEALLKDEDVLALEDEEILEFKDDEEIIEITEFDQHFGYEDEIVSGLTDLMDASDSEEEDFLELIEVEEDSEAEDEQFNKLGDSDDEITDAVINRFFSEASDEEADLASDSQAQIEKTPELRPDSAIDTTAPPSGAEEFDFDSDSKEISEHIDRPDALLPEDSMVASDGALFTEDQPEEDKFAVKDSPESVPAEESLPVTPEQIDAAIERVINERFAGKIENIICEVIEKAVSKEIDRLKGILLENNTHEDGQGE